MEGPSKTPDRTFFACDRNADKQGISVSWVDQYNQAVPGQELDITGAPAGEYFLVSLSNPDHLLNLIILIIWPGLNLG